MTIYTKPCVVNLVHMGDSITFGQHVDPKLRWTSLIVERLDDIYLDTPIHIHALNRGVSGETTRQGLERFPSAVQTVQPDVLTLQFGMNDCNCWLTDRGLPRVSEAAFRTNLLEMISRARRFDVAHIIVANNHRSLRSKVMLSGEAYEDANARYSDIIRQVAAASETVFCDIRQAFAGYPQDKLKELLLPYPDHLHLSIAGHRLYADTIWPCILEAVQIVVHNKIAMEKR